MSRIHDPELEFGDPRSLADDPALTQQQKLRILEDWKLDLMELQKAEEENMPSVGGEPDMTARKLSEVTRVIEAVTMRPGAGAKPRARPQPVAPGRGQSRPGRERDPDPVPLDRPRPARPRGPID